jgi:hypothetical protein
MSSSPANTLLALLLALKDLDASLSPREQAQLFEVGELLDLDPDDWEFIDQRLMSIINGNYRLKSLFETANKKLKTLSSSISQLLPTERERQQILFTDEPIETRGYIDYDSNLESAEFLNLSVIILKENDPAEIIKQLTWIDRIKKILPSQTN